MRFAGLMFRRIRQRSQSSEDSRHSFPGQTPPPKCPRESRSPQTCDLQNSRSTLKFYTAFMFCIAYVFHCIFTARPSYAIAVLGVVILSVCPSDRLSVRLSHACFVTNPKNLPVIFLYHILITANMQSKTGFPSSYQSKSYVALSPI